MVPLKLILKMKLSLTSEIMRVLSNWVSKIPLNRQIAASQRNTAWPYDNWTYEKPIRIRGRGNYTDDIYQYDDWSQESMTYDKWYDESLWQNNWTYNSAGHRSCQRTEYVSDKRRTDTTFEESCKD